MSDDTDRLRCIVRGSEIDIGVGAELLAFAAASHPEYWDGKSGPDVANIKVDDPVAFAREVCAALNRESEDGSTLLTRMLDKAISLAVESGCDGVDHGWNCGQVASELRTDEPTG